MTISHIAGRTPAALVVLLREAFASSALRFHVGEVTLSRCEELIYIKHVKLKGAKDYCGNHPAACERIGIRHVKRRFLEGADWVEFNDTLNDLLDTFCVSAVVQSFVRDGTTDRLPLRIRCGMHRRSNYKSGYFNGQKSAPRENQVWQGRGHADADYAVNSGFDMTRVEKDNADFPAGTPGINERIGYSEEG